SAAPGGADGGHRPAAREGDGRRSARLRDPRGRKLTVPGLIERREQHGETTVVVDPARLLEAAAYLRDTEGFRFLSDIAATDYLGWGETPIAGYIGTPDGRDINRPSTRAPAKTPAPKPKRFSVSYHLLALQQGAPRVRLQIWL